MFRLSGYGQILYTFKSFVTWLLKVFGELARTSNRFWAISDIWDFPTKLQHFGEMAITSLLRYFGEISEISTHYNDITFLKFRGNIRNLPVSIEVLQTCLKISDISPKYYKLLLTYFSTSFKNIGENLTIFSFQCIIFRRCMFFLGVLLLGCFWDFEKIKKNTSSLKFYHFLSLLSQQNKPFFWYFYHIFQIFVRIYHPKKKSAWLFQKLILIN